MTVACLEHVFHSTDIISGYGSSIHFIDCNQAPEPLRTTSEVAQLEDKRKPEKVILDKVPKRKLDSEKPVESFPVVEEPREVEEQVYKRPKVLSVHEDTVLGESHHDKLKEEDFHPDIETTDSDVVVPIILGEVELENDSETIVTELGEPDPTKVDKMYKAPVLSKFTEIVPLKEVPVETGTLEWPKLICQSESESSSGDETEEETKLDEEKSFRDLLVPILVQEGEDDQTGVQKELFEPQRRGLTTFKHKSVELLLDDPEEDKEEEEKEETSPDKNLESGALNNFLVGQKIPQCKVEESGPAEETTEEVTTGTEVVFDKLSRFLSTEKIELIPEVEVVLIEDEKVENEGNTPEVTQKRHLSAGSIPVMAEESPEAVDQDAPLFDEEKPDDISARFLWAESNVVRVDTDDMVELQQESEEIVSETPAKFFRSQSEVYLASERQPQKEKLEPDDKSEVVPDDNSQSGINEPVSEDLELEYKDLLVPIFVQDVELKNFTDEILEELGEADPDATESRYPLRIPQKLNLIVPLSEIDPNVEPLQYSRITSIPSDLSIEEQQICALDLSEESSYVSEHENGACNFETEPAELPLEDAGELELLEPEKNEIKVEDTLENRQENEETVSEVSPEMYTQHSEKIEPDVEQALKEPQIETAKATDVAPEFESKATPVVVHSQQVKQETLPEKETLFDAEVSETMSEVSKTLTDLELDVPVEVETVPSKSDAETLPLEDAGELELLEPEKTEMKADDTLEKQPENEETVSEVSPAMFIQFSEEKLEPDDEQALKGPRTESAEAADVTPEFESKATPVVVHSQPVKQETLPENEILFDAEVSETMPEVSKTLTDLELDVPVEVETVPSKSDAETLPLDDAGDLELLEREKAEMKADGTFENQLDNEKTASQVSAEIYIQQSEEKLEPDVEQALKEPQTETAEAADVTPEFESKATPVVVHSQPVKQETLPEKEILFDAEVSETMPEVSKTLTDLELDVPVEVETVPSKSDAETLPLDDAGELELLGREKAEIKADGTLENQLDNEETSSQVSPEIYIQQSEEKLEPDVEQALKEPQTETAEAANVTPEFESKATPVVVHSQPVKQETLPEKEILFDAEVSETMPEVSKTLTDLELDVPVEVETVPSKADAETLPLENAGELELFEPEKTEMKADDTLENQPENEETVSEVSPAMFIQFSEEKLEPDDEQALKEPRTESAEAADVAPVFESKATPLVVHSQPVKQETLPEREILFDAEVSETMPEVSKTLTDLELDAPVEVESVPSKADAETLPLENAGELEFLEPEKTEMKAGDTLEKQPENEETVSEVSPAMFIQFSEEKLEPDDEQALKEPRTESAEAVDVAPEFESKATPVVVHSQPVKQETLPEKEILFDAEVSETMPEVSKTLTGLGLDVPVEVETVPSKSDAETLPLYDAGELELWEPEKTEIKADDTLENQPENEETKSEVSPAMFIQSSEERLEPDHEQALKEPRTESAEAVDVAPEFESKATPLVVHSQPVKQETLPEKEILFDAEVSETMPEVSKTLTDLELDVPVEVETVPSKADAETLPLEKAGELDLLEPEKTEIKADDTLENQPENEETVSEVSPAMFIQFSEEKLEPDDEQALKEPRTESAEAADVAPVFESKATPLVVHSQPVKQETLPEKEILFDAEVSETMPEVSKTLTDLELDVPVEVETVPSKADAETLPLENAGELELLEPEKTEMKADGTLENQLDNEETVSEVSPAMFIQFSEEKLEPDVEQALKEPQTETAEAADVKPEFESKATPVVLHSQPVKQETLPAKEILFDAEASEKMPEVSKTLTDLELDVPVEVETVPSKADAEALPLEDAGELERLEPEKTEMKADHTLENQPENEETVAEVSPAMFIQFSEEKLEPDVEQALKEPQTETAEAADVKPEFESKATPLVVHSQPVKQEKEILFDAEVSETTPEVSQTLTDLELDVPVEVETVPSKSDAETLPLDDAGELELLEREKTEMKADGTLENQLENEETVSQVSPELYIQHSEKKLEPDVEQALKVPQTETAEAADVTPEFESKATPVVVHSQPVKQETLPGKEILFDAEVSERMPEVSKTLTDLELDVPVEVETVPSKSDAETLPLEDAGELELLEPEKTDMKADGTFENQPENEETVSEVSPEMYIQQSEEKLEPDVEQALKEPQSETAEAADVASEFESKATPLVVHSQPVKQETLPEKEIFFDAEVSETMPEVSKTLTDVELDVPVEVETVPSKSDAETLPLEDAGELELLEPEKTDMKADGTFENQPENEETVSEVSPEMYIQQSEEKLEPDVEQALKEPQSETAEAADVASEFESKATPLVVHSQPVKQETLPEKEILFDAEVSETMPEVSKTLTDVELDMSVEVETVPSKSDAETLPLEDAGELERLELEKTEIKADGSLENQLENEETASQVSPEMYIQHSEEKLEPDVEQALKERHSETAEAADVAPEFESKATPLVVHSQPVKQETLPEEEILFDAEVSETIPEVSKTLTDLELDVPVEVETVPSKSDAETLPLEDAGELECLEPEKTEMNAEDTLESQPENEETVSEVSPEMYIQQSEEKLEPDVEQALKEPQSETAEAADVAPEFESKATPLVVHSQPVKQETLPEEEILFDAEVSETIPEVSKTLTDLELDVPVEVETVPSKSDAETLPLEDAGELERLELEKTEMKADGTLENQLENEETVSEVSPEMYIQQSEEKLEPDVEQALKEPQSETAEAADVKPEFESKATPVVVHSQPVKQETLPEEEILFDAEVSETIPEVSKTLTDLELDVPVEVETVPSKSDAETLPLEDAGELERLELEKTEMKADGTLENQLENEETVSEVSPEMYIQQSEEKLEPDVEQALKEPQSETAEAADVAPEFESKATPLVVHSRPVKQETLPEKEILFDAEVSETMPEVSKTLTDLELDVPVEVETVPSKSDAETLPLEDAGELERLELEKTEMKADGTLENQLENEETASQVSPEVYIQHSEEKLEPDVEQALKEPQSETAEAADVAPEFESKATPLVVHSRPVKQATLPEKEILFDAEVSETIPEVSKTLTDLELDVPVEVETVPSKSDAETLPLDDAGELELLEREKAEMKADGTLENQPGNEETVSEVSPKMYIQQSEEKLEPDVEQALKEPQSETAEAADVAPEFESKATPLVVPSQPVKQETLPEEEILFDAEVSETIPEVSKTLTDLELDVPVEVETVASKSDAETLPLENAGELECLEPEKTEMNAEDTLESQPENEETVSEVSPEMYIQQSEEKLEPDIEQALKEPQTQTVEAADVAPEFEGDTTPVVVNSQPVKQGKLPEKEILFDAEVSETMPEVSKTLTDLELDVPVEVETVPSKSDAETLPLEDAGELERLELEKTEMKADGTLENQLENEETVSEVSPEMYIQQSEEKLEPDVEQALKEPQSETAEAADVAPEFESKATPLVVHSRPVKQETLPEKEILFDAEVSETMPEVSKTLTDLELDVPVEVETVPSKSDGETLPLEDAGELERLELVKTEMKADGTLENQLENEETASQVSPEMYIQHSEEKLEPDVEQALKEPQSETAAVADVAPEFEGDTTPVVVHSQPVKQETLPEKEILFDAEVSETMPEVSKTLTDLELDVPVEVETVPNKSDAETLPLEDAGELERLEPEKIEMKADDTLENQPENEGTVSQVSPEMYIQLSEDKLEPDVEQALKEPQTQTVESADVAPEFESKATPLVVHSRPVKQETLPEKEILFDAEVSETMPEVSKTLTDVELDMSVEVETVPSKSDAETLPLEDAGELECLEPEKTEMNAEDTRESQPENEETVSQVSPEIYIQHSEEKLEPDVEQALKEPQTQTVEAADVLPEFESKATPVVVHTQPVTLPEKEIPFGADVCEPMPESSKTLTDLGLDMLFEVETVPSTADVETLPLDGACFVGSGVPAFSTQNVAPIPPSDLEPSDLETIQRHSG